MRKNCIRCKREILSSQDNCLVCGAPQSYFLYYIKTALVFLMLICAVLIALYWYEDQPKKLAELTRLKAIANDASNSQTKISQLKILLEQTNNKLKLTQEKLDLSEKNISAENESASKRNIKFKKNKGRALKAEKRASWLSKENNRLKTENKSLNEKLLALQTDPSRSSLDQSASPFMIKPSTYPADLEAPQQPLQEPTENEILD